MLRMPIQESIIRKICATNAYTGIYYKEDLSLLSHDTTSLTRAVVGPKINFIDYNVRDRC